MKGSAQKFRKSFPDSHCWEVAGGIQPDCREAYEVIFQVPDRSLGMITQMLQIFAVWEVPASWRNGFLPWNSDCCRNCRRFVAGIAVRELVVQMFLFVFCANVYIKACPTKMNRLENDPASKLFKLDDWEKKSYLKEQDLEFYSSVGAKLTSENDNNRTQFTFQCKFCLLHSVKYWHWLMQWLAKHDLQFWNARWPTMK